MYFPNLREFGVEIVEPSSSVGFLVLSRQLAVVITVRLLA